MKYLYKISYLLCFVFFSPQTLYANDVATKINAGSMNYAAKDNTIKFSKNVFVERDNFYLWADTIIVHLAEDTNINAHNMQGIKEAEIKKIEAIGKVSMEYGNSRGFSGLAEYDVEKNLLSMKEKPIFEDGDNAISGDEILYYLDENRSEVVGGTNRVRAVFSGSLQSTEENATSE